MTSLRIFATIAALGIAAAATAQTGVKVAVGDINGDGVAETITGANPGGPPQVRVVDGAGGKQLMLFLAFEAGFTGGVNVAAGDINGDGRADIITGAGPGGGPHVKVFDRKTGAVIRSWMAFAPRFKGGVSVAVQDQNGDGRADIVTTAGGSPAQVTVFSGKDGAVLASYMLPARPGRRN